MGAARDKSRAWGRDEQNPLAMLNNITLPTTPPAVSPDAQKAPEASKATVTAESEKTMKRDPLEQMLTPKAREALRKLQPPVKPVQAPPADDKSKAAAPSAEITPPPATSSTTPPAAAKSDDVKPKETPDDGVIDFTKLNSEEGKPKTGEDDELPALTDAELADHTVVKTKLNDAHKTNANLRKQRREAREQADGLKAQVDELTKKLEDASSNAAQPNSRFIDRYHKPEELTSARADAMEILRQLSDDASLAVIQLPGNRPWNLLDAQGNHHGADAAKWAIDILDGYDSKIEQINGRSTAEQMVADKLPQLKTLVPSIEDDYQKNLKADWDAKAPELSLNAALGGLVTRGDYVLVPRAKAGATTSKPAAQQAAPPPAELPNTPPAPVVTEKGANPEAAALWEKAKKGDQTALQKWLRLPANSK